MNNLFRSLKYKVALTLVNIRIWLALKVIYILAKISKKPEHMQQYNALCYKFYHN